jgi:hypothetical protein
MTVALNFVAFQLGWFACVLGAAHGWPWAGTGVALAIVAWHVARAERPRGELLLVLVAAAIGAAWDSALALAGWIRYPAGALIEGTAPHWIVALWMLFATTLNLSLAWLKRSAVLAAVFGAAGGPLAYWAGERLGALTLAEPAVALFALAAGWAVLTPLLLQIAARFAGLRPRAIFTGPTHA